MKTLTNDRHHRFLCLGTEVGEQICLMLGHMVEEVRTQITLPSSPVLCDPEYQVPTHPCPFTWIVNVICGIGAD